MASGDPESDVAAGLSELECKLRELERAFSTLGHEYDGRPTEPPPEDHLAPVPPATDAPADAPAPEPDDRIEELARTQARLSATLEALQADVSRLVDGLAKPPPGAPQAPSAAAPPPPPPPPPPAPPPPPIPPIHPL